MHDSMKLPSRPGTYTVGILAGYSVLWFALAVYVGYSTGGLERYDEHVTSAILIIALLLHFVTTTALTRAGVITSVLALAALALPTGLLLLHDTRSPYVYIAYLAAHGIIAAYIVHSHAESSTHLPAWLASLQTAYIVLLLLDTLGQAFPRVLYPAVNLELLEALHRLSDLRVLLLSPIVVTWLVLAITRCKQDGSFEDLPPVWRTDLALPSALLQLPARFPLAVVSFLQVVLYRVWADFLFTFRDHLQHLARYLATISATGALLLAVRGYSPNLVYYLEEPTSFSDLVQQPALIAAPVIGFAFFLAVPFLTAFLASLWGNEASSEWLRDRAYLLAVTAAVPCTVIGPVLWIVRGWLELPGFSTLGIVSWTAIAGVAGGLLLGRRLQALRPSASSAPAPAKVPAGTRRVLRWPRQWPPRTVGAAAAVALVFGLGAWGVVRNMAGGSTQLMEGQTLAGQGIREGKWRFYWIDVPAGAAKLQVTMTGPAPGRLYMRRERKPRLSTRRCPAADEVTSVCTRTQPRAGRWWIGIYGSARSSASVTPSITYTIAGNAGGRNVRVVAARNGRAVQTRADAAGNYVLSGIPAGTYRVAPIKPECTFRGDTLPVSVGPSTARKNFSMQCPSAYTELAGNQTLSGERVGREWNYYLVDVPAGRDSLVVEIAGTGDVSLYTRPGLRPSDGYSYSSGPYGGIQYHYDCRQYIRTAVLTCRHRRPAQGQWWIGVPGSSSGGSYSVVARY